MRKPSHLPLRLRLCATVLVLGCLTVSQAGADEPLAAVTVRGARPGPRLWEVRSGDARLWILGTVSPLPTGMTWRSSEVEQLLARTDAVLAARPLEITVTRALWIMLAERSLVMNPGGKTLRDVLPPGLYAEFATLRSRYAVGRDKWERYRPIVAAALLEDQALSAHGLSTRLDVSLTVRRLAREHHVAFVEVKVPGGADLLTALESVPADVEQRCVEVILHTIASGMPALEERADAWASGDADRLRGAPPSPQQVCSELMATDSGTGRTLALARSRWLAALQDRLLHPGNTLAVIDMDLVLSGDGLLANLRAAGYSIEGP